MLSRIEQILFPQKHTKLPFLFWLPLVSTLLMLMFAAIKGMAFWPVFLIFALISLPIAYRYAFQGALSSSLGALVLTFACSSYLKEGVGFVFALTVIGMIVNYWLISWVGETLNKAFADSPKKIEEAKADATLWKGRFDTHVVKHEQLKEEYEQAKGEFERKEDEYYDALDAHKELMEISRGENQQLFEQNQLLMEESSRHLQQIAHLEANKDVEALEKRIKELQKELNEVRVQHYQDRLLYEHFKKETEALQKSERSDLTSLDSDQVEAALKESINASNATSSAENIYLNIK